MASHAAAMARVARVTGMPTRAWVRQPILTPSRPAWSTTMMLAMLPTISRLPASVLYAGGGPGIVEGVIQVDLRVPGGLPARAPAPVVLWMGGISSQAGLTVALGP